MAFASRGKSASRPGSLQDPGDGRPDKNPGGEAAIVWAMVPYGNANTTITNSRLLAYAAEDFGRYADGSGQLIPLWDLQDWNWNLLHPKFNRPIAVDGRMLVPTYGGELLILTLA